MSSPPKILSVDRTKTVCLTKISKVERMEELERQSYKEVQQIAKALNLQSNFKKAVLINMIVAHNACDFAEVAKIKKDALAERRRVKKQNAENRIVEWKEKRQKKLKIMPFVLYENGEEVKKTPSNYQIFINNKINNPSFGNVNNIHKSNEKLKEQLSKAVANFKEKAAQNGAASASGNGADRQAPAEKPSSAIVETNVSNFVWNGREYLNPMYSDVSEDSHRQQQREGRLQVADKASQTLPVIVYSAPPSSLLHREFTYIPYGETVPRTIYVRSVDENNNNTEIEGSIDPNHVAHDPYGRYMRPLMQNPWPYGYLNNDVYYERPMVYGPILNQNIPDHNMYSVAPRLPAMTEAFGDNYVVRSYADMNVEAPSLNRLYTNQELENLYNEYTAAINNGLDHNSDDQPYVYYDIQNDDESSDANALLQQNLVSTSVFHVPEATATDVEMANAEDEAANNDQGSANRSGDTANNVNESDYMPNEYVLAGEIELPIESQMDNNCVAYEASISSLVDVETTSQCSETGNPDTEEP